jgi:hypothetical protein
VLAKVEEVLLAERAFVQLQKDQVSEGGDFSNGPARHCPILRVRGTKQYKNGAKNQ